MNRYSVCTIIILLIVVIADSILLYRYHPNGILIIGIIILIICILIIIEIVYKSLLKKQPIREAVYPPAYNSVDEALHIDDDELL